MAYEKKYKMRAIEYHEEGNSIRHTAKAFKISPNALNEWLKECRNEGEFKVKPRVCDTGKIKECELVAYLDKNPETYQQDTAKIFGYSQAVVCKAIKRFKTTRKKDKTL